MNRFILLALIGARKCIHGRSIAADTAVYLTTEHGNLGETATVLDEIYAAHSLPKPFSFINTMSNTAAFYLAQNLGTRGRNITVSSQCLSFERGLDLACSGFCRGRRAKRPDRRRGRGVALRGRAGRIGMVAAGGWSTGAAGFTSGPSGRGPAGSFGRTGRFGTVRPA